MEVGREGHSGLYTMHFNNILPPPRVITSFSHIARKNALADFSNWHVLIRMNVENDVCFVKGEAKVFSPTPSLASLEARGMRPECSHATTTTTPVTSPEGRSPIAVHQRDRKCHVFIEGRCGSQDAADAAVGANHAAAHHPGSATNHSAGSSCGAAASSFRLEVHFDRFEAALLGLNEPAEFKNVVLSCSGSKVCGWHMGPVVVTVDGNEIAMRTPLRFLLRPYYGKRCVHCLDPVYAIGYVCGQCRMAHYCSRECMDANLQHGHHALLCPHLRQRYNVRSGVVATEVSDDTGLVAWWRCLDRSYTILADSRHALDYAIEFTLSTVRSAREDGLQYRFIVPGSANGADAAAQPARVPSMEEVVDFCCVLLREVNRAAVLDGYVALSAACLNYLYVFSPSLEITIQAHVLFFTAFHCEEFDGSISTVEEYVSYARPLHALATLQIEYALKSTIPAEFWRRIKIAKDVVIALFTVNASGPCAEMEVMRDNILTQQCETLTLLCKVFVIMATRAPQDEARRWLEQGEKCLRQCCESEAMKRDSRHHAFLCFRLATLLLLFREDAKTEESRQLRAKGEALLRGAKESAVDKDKPQAKAPK